MQFSNIARISADSVLTRVVVMQTKVGETNIGVDVNDEGKSRSEVCFGRPTFCIIDDTTVKNSSDLISCVVGEDSLGRNGKG